MRSIMRVTGLTAAIGLLALLGCDGQGGQSGARSNNKAYTLAVVNQTQKTIPTGEVVWVGQDFSKPMKDVGPDFQQAFPFVWEDHPVPEAVKLSWRYEGDDPQIEKQLALDPPSDRPWDWISLRIQPDDSIDIEYKQYGPRPDEQQSN